MSTEMTEDELEAFAGIIRNNEEALGELRARMLAAIDDKSRPLRLRVAEYRRLRNEASLHAEQIEGAWQKLLEML
jgi:hypothetical protein